MALKAPIPRYWLRGNLRQADVMAIEGLQRIIAYHASLASGSGAPRVWPFAEDANVISVYNYLVAATGQTFPPAVNPA